MRGFPGGSVVKNLPTNAGDTGDAGLISGSGRSLEKEVATHSNILAWKIPQTKEPGRLQSIGLPKVDMAAHSRTYIVSQELEQTL